MPISPERKEARRQHIVQTAQQLIRDTGSAGFSMSELAERAGVSSATPYNLVGSKSQLLRFLIRDEFEQFNLKLISRLKGGALDRLFIAVDLIVEHYTADPEFYFGIYRSSVSGDALELQPVLNGEGLKFWSAMIQHAMDSGELARTVAAPTLTKLFLRFIGAVVYGWLLEQWGVKKFREQMRLASRLLFLGLLPSDKTQAMVASLPRR